MCYKLVPPLAGLALTVAAFAQPFDGLTTQQREWRFREEIWNTMKASSDATRRFDENIKG